MTINVGLLKETLAHIEANPQEWEQGAWRCKTGMCFAGHAAALAGGQWLFPNAEELDEDGLGGDAMVAMVPTPAEIADGYTQLYEDEKRAPVEVIFAADRARRVLGLTSGERSRLFAGNNTLTDLRRIVAELCTEATS